jgi:hypothetical protein
MTSKRIGLVTGGLLAGALLLGTAGLVAAQDPTATPTPGPTTVSPGGMMGGQMGAGMMGGQMGAGMMGGQMGTMTADQLDQMNALHDQMIENGLCDPAQMHATHSQLNADR